MNTVATLAERLKTRLAHVETGFGSPCWLWQGPLTLGYCRIALPGTKKKVWGHRISYEAHKGAIPPGLCIDHLCRRRSCINPDHLEPVTHRENMRRAAAAGVMGRYNADKTRCPAGHPYSEKNTRIERRGGRTCRTCERAREKARGPRVRKPRSISPAPSSRAGAASVGLANLDGLAATVRLSPLSSLAVAGGFSA